ncbi:hypothetical protein EV284_1651 [Streptomyces sp. BK022]|uniref:hypothetical protein n=1 Tax=Streptomyces sp. BK022 TaxID=2512123 RepID=UPI001028BB3B|nr:hypothetical protein [Streptomyces sp. BK022]RZU44192.1 hypothetical protein EV284_1651 [Streptomyces sp. BK022]
MKPVEEAGSIASPGWDGLIRRVASDAASHAPAVGAVLDTLIAMGGTVPVEHGLGALPRESRELVGVLRTLPCLAAAPRAEDGAERDRGADEGYGEGLAVGIAADGRTHLVRLPDGLEPVAVIRGATPAAARRLAAALDRWRSLRQAADAEREEIRRWLAARDRAEVDDRLAHLGHLLLHMAPLRTFVGDTSFTNLGKGNLPGRSVAADHEASVLRRLRAEPVERWSAEEAAFVGVCWVLMASGPQSRLEEANGMCLDLPWLSDFLAERANRYGLRPAGPAGKDAHDIDVLLELAARLAECRAGLLREGRTFYREIHGASLHKEERLLPGTPGHRSLTVGGHTWSMWPESAPSTAHMGRHAALRVRRAPAAERSDTRALTLHDLLREVAGATRSDVALARGPRDLALIDEDPASALAFGTGDFYCCVVAGTEFADRRRGQEPPLHRILTAYSARMRFNSWHYLPHVLGRTDQERDDWFFAPTMPDLTHGSQWHHTGHVKFGVRHAIRVPFATTLGGRDLPGLHDLRLVRTTDEPYTLRELETAVAFGQVLRAFHEDAFAVCRDAVTQFDNAWFRSAHED